ncbi:MAG: hypothetical protein GEU79_16880, partial [Acidimicrobiia bacterium]|nr:hypothetical protein [Acidimicrobiia bacterium]
MPHRASGSPVDLFPRHTLPTHHHGICTTTHVWESVIVALLRHTRFYHRRDRIHRSGRELGTSCIALRSGSKHHDGMLRFSIAGIPVSVRPFFWLVAIFLGYGFIRRDVFQPEWLGVANWVAIVFLGVLCHEMGHALVARRFGATVRIVLTTFGGYTAWGLPDTDGTDAARAMSPGLRAVVAVAGSAVGVVIGLGALGVQILGRSAGGWPPDVFFITNAIIWVNLGWGVLNWVPLRPLDGGHILEAGLEAVFGERSKTISSRVFLVLSAMAAYFAWRFDLIFIAFLAVFLALSELRRLSPEPTAVNRQRPVMSYDDPEPDSNPNPNP